MRISRGGTQESRDEEMSERMENPNGRKSEDRGYRRACVLVTATIYGALAIAYVTAMFSKTGQSDPQNLSWILFVRQDFVFALLIPLAFLLKTKRARADDSGGVFSFILRPGVLVGIAISLIVLCRMGHHFVFFDRNLSGDERMADFDARIFAHGRLFWVIPGFWRHFALALNQILILPVAHHRAWVSGYLPMNAAATAAMGALGDRSLTSPLFVAIGLLALWRVSTRLLSDSPSAQAVTLQLYVSSAQVVIAGMTTFAMSGELCLNLLWLAFFLEDRPATHLGAVIVGFFATGLHHLHWNLMFVLPFLCLLFAQKRWRLLAFYAVSYGIIVGFWYEWSIWLSVHAGGGVVLPNRSNPGFLQLLVGLLHPPTLRGVSLMAINLLRFATWQNLLMLPLMSVGLAVAWKGDSMARALAVGFILPIPLAFMVVPWQGYGWGYRYLHGVIGNACLLGGYGWRALELQGWSLRRAFRLATVVTFLGVLPARAQMARMTAAPFAHVAKEIAASKADIAIVADDSALLSVDLVANLPDLSNRPIILRESKLTPADMRALCAHGSVVFFGPRQLRPINEYFYGEPAWSSPNLAALEAEAQRLHCDLLPAT